jgi:hypothetical protein
MASPDFTPDPLRQEEFRALRATIRERGSLRVATALGGLVSWAALHLAVQAWFPTPVTFLVPLLILVAAFEGVYALHIGVERIGRYIEACYETGMGEAVQGPQWEHAAHAFGRRFTDGAGRLDPLFAVVFVSATVLNLVPIVLQTVGGPPVELIVYGSLHLLVILRIARARRFASRQRGIELELFDRISRGD